MSAPGFPLSGTSLARLKGVHNDLVRVVETAATLSDLEFQITEGLRTKEKQAQLLKARATTTLNSRHLTGHAVDVCIFVHGELRWDWPLYERLSTIMKTAAMGEKVDLTWGGDWVSFKDGCHYELSWGSYPAPRATA